jgi:hypothetical protein
MARGDLTRRSSDPRIGREYPTPLRFRIFHNRIAHTLIPVGVLFNDDTLKGHKSTSIASYFAETGLLAMATGRSPERWFWDREQGYAKALVRYQSKCQVVMRVGRNYQYKEEH